MARTSTVVASSRTRTDLLGIYLNDHLAGATAGTQLARRVSKSHQNGPDGTVLEQFAKDVADDRASLVRFMYTLGVTIRTYKVYAAWIGEKAGLLKFNGRLLTRSPLSSLEELEILELGVQGKAAGWRTLLTLAETDHRLNRDKVQALISRAERQAELLEEIRRRAADRVIRSRAA
jgi:hypothetical protein